MITAKGFHRLSKFLHRTAMECVTDERGNFLYYTDLGNIWFASSNGDTALVSDPAGMTNEQLTEEWKSLFIDSQVTITERPLTEEELSLIEQGKGYVANADQEEAPKEAPETQQSYGQPSGVRY